jgi:competence ComEA-like helix-hairpin-helix protein
MEERRLAAGLAWLGIGIGIAEIAAPRSMGRTLGMENRRGTLRAFGLREIATGAGILARRNQVTWLWGRVAGDLLDLAVLATAPARREKRRNVALAAAVVGGTLAMDILCARRLAERDRPMPRREEQRVAEPDAEWSGISIETHQARKEEEPTAKYGKGELLDVNEATLEELLSIGGLSRTGAEAILRYREKHGRFRMMNELERLPQLSADEFMAVRDAVIIVAETEEEEEHRLEKPDITTEVGGRGM